MKKNVINYYGLLVLGLYITYNLIFCDLRIGGLLYQIFMFMIIILNILIVIKFKKNIMYKEIIVIIYFLIWLFSQNILQCIFGISNIILFIALGFMESHSIKVITILLITIIFCFSLPLLLAFLLTLATRFNNEDGLYDVYKDSHYYCDNHYEAYSYSAGAMDSFHYSIGKHYAFIRLMIYYT